jgi:hypothetical protein
LRGQREHFLLLRPLCRVQNLSDAASRQERNGKTPPGERKKMALFRGF